MEGLQRPHKRILWKRLQQKQTLCGRSRTLRFLEINEVWRWCEDAGLAIDSSGRLAPDDRYEGLGREVFAHGAPSGREADVARSVVAALAPWDECLLWIVGWGVWSSTEDWPAFYAARGAHGEKRALDVAPAMLARPEDTGMLTEFLTMALRFGWDAHVLPARSGSVTPKRAFASHDEWVELSARSA